MALRLSRYLQGYPTTLDLKEEYPELFDLWCQCVNLDDTVCMLLEEDEDGNEEEIKNCKNNPKKFGTILNLQEN